VGYVNIYLIATGNSAKRKTSQKKQNKQNRKRMRRGKE